MFPVLYDRRLKWNLYLGHLNEEYLREILTTMGDRFTDEEVRKLTVAYIHDDHCWVQYVQYHPMMCHCTACTGNGFLLGSFVNFVCLPRLIELLAHFKFHSITCHFDVHIVIIIDEIVWSTYCCISGRWAIQRSPHKRIKVWLYRIHSNTQTWQKGGRRMS